MKKYVVGLVCMICAMTLNAQKYSISGIVKNQQGTPIPDASVVVLNTFLGVVSNKDGAFILDKLAPGEYQIEVSFVGYETVTKQLMLQHDVSLVITLPFSSVNLNPVLLTAIQAKETMPFAQTTISERDITNRNIGQDITFVLDHTPSVVSTSENGTGYGYTNMRVRGTDITRINVTINGVPLNDAESHNVFWVNMADFASSVDAVQIQRGVGTSTNGAASFGASLNFQTLGIQEKPAVQLSSTIGSFNTIKTLVSGTTGILDSCLSFTARYSKLTSDGYVQRGFSDHESMHISGAFFAKKHTITANAMLGRQRTGITWVGIPDYLLENDRTYNIAGRYYDQKGNEHFYDNEVDSYKQNHYSLHYNYAASKYLNVSGTIHATTGNGYYEQFKENAKLSKYGIKPIQLHDTLAYDEFGDVSIFPDSMLTRTNLIRQKWLDNVFYGYTAGATYNKNKITVSIGNSYNIYDGEHFGYVTNLNFVPDFEKYLWYSNTGKKTDLNVFAKIHYQITNTLSIFADAQQRNITYAMHGIDDDLYELDSTYTWNFFNPKGGLFYKIDNKNSMFISYAISNREPARSDLRDVREKQLFHETLYDLEFGYQYKRQKAAIALNFYSMKYDNQLVLTGRLNEVGAAIKENAKDSYRRGIECVVGVRPVKEFEWNANVTLSQNKILNYIEYATNYDENWNEQQIETHHGITNISYSPNVIASSTFSFYADECMTFGIQSKYVGSQYFDNMNSEMRKLDAYIVHNFQFEYAFLFEKARAFRIQFTINNLLNKMYESNAYGWNWYEQGVEKMERFYFPQAGIHYMCKLTLDL